MSSICIDNFLRENINYLLQKEILYKEVLEEMESTRKNELIRGQEKYKLKKCWWFMSLDMQREYGIGE